MTETGKTIWQLFTTFLRIAPATFGGGFAVMPAMEKEVVEKRKWMDSEDIGDVFAVAQSIPGAVAINSATFIGYRIAGIRGALAAMIGMLLPTFCIIVVLSYVFLQVKDNPKIEAAFLSIRATIVALIAYAAIKYGKKALVDKASAVLIGVTVLLLFVGGSLIHPLLIIAGGAAAGIVIQAIKAKLGQERSKELRQERSGKVQEQIFDYMI
ncbi:chromate transporter [Paenibacillus agaridevorans]|uniref:Chromate transporter n=1 Tax=Paenibacillus agaridevorans TaxID=171404 RepID=A0A2R5F6U2_9BACL|nr:chromate transporter [Paenibacillus agaridevorans]GBG12361.1 chromate transporter [Paenibacillus agaridevorans]